jgi:hypothetical protein
LIGGMLNRGAALNFRELPVSPNSAAWAAVWQPYVEPCIEFFGAERCTFKSNFWAVFVQVRCGRPGRGLSRGSDPDKGRFRSRFHHPLS